MGVLAGGDLAKQLVSMVQAVNEGAAIVQGYEEAWWNAAVGIGVALTMFVPVIGPLISGTVTAVQIYKEGKDYVVAFVENGEVQSGASVLGYAKTIESADKMSDAQGKLLMALGSAALEYPGFKDAFNTTKNIGIKFVKAKVLKTGQTANAVNSAGNAAAAAGSSAAPLKVDPSLPADVKKGIEIARTSGIKGADDMISTAMSPIAGEGVYDAQKNLASLGHLENIVAEAKLAGVTEAEIQTALNRARQTNTMQAWGTDLKKELLFAELKARGATLIVNPSELQGVQEFFGAGGKPGVAMVNPKGTAYSSIAAKMKLMAKGVKYVDFTEAEMKILFEDLVPNGTGITKWYGVDTEAKDIFQYFDQQFIHDTETVLGIPMGGGTPSGLVASGGKVDFASLRPDQVAKLTPAQWKQLTPDVFKTLPKDLQNALGQQALKQVQAAKEAAALVKGALNASPNISLGANGLTQDQFVTIKHLTANQFAALPEEVKTAYTQMAQSKLAAIAKQNAENAAFEAKANAFAAAQQQAPKLDLNKLTPEQIGQLTPQQLAAITPEQFGQLKNATQAAIQQAVFNQAKKALALEVGLAAGPTGSAATAVSAGTSNAPSAASAPSPGDMSKIPPNYISPRTDWTADDTSYIDMKIDDLVTEAGGDPKAWVKQPSGPGTAVYKGPDGTTLNGAIKGGYMTITKTRAAASTPANRAANNTPSTSAVPAGGTGGTEIYNGGYGGARPGDLFAMDSAVREVLRGKGFTGDFAVTRNSDAYVYTHAGTQTSFEINEHAGMTMTITQIPAGAPIVRPSTGTPLYSGGYGGARPGDLFAMDSAVKEILGGKGFKGDFDVTRNGDSLVYTNKATNTSFEVNEQPGGKMTITQIPAGASIIRGASTGNSSGTSTGGDTSGACVDGGGECVSESQCGDDCVNVQKECVGGAASCAGSATANAAAKAHQLMIAAASAVKAAMGKLVGDDAAVVEPRGGLKARLTRWMPRLGFRQHNVDASALFVPGAVVHVVPRELRGETSASAADDAAVSFISNGSSTGVAFDVQVTDRTGRRRRVAVPEGVVLEPLTTAPQPPASRPRDVSGAAAQQIGAFCLEFAKLPPAAGMLYKVADQATQERFRPLRSVLTAARSMATRGLLHPDSNPASYFDSIKQYALWAKRENWDAKKFAEAFVDRTKKNAVALKRNWTKEMESAVTAAAPGRWRDVSAILAEANATAGAAGGR
jgi:hypothetical protein